MANLHMGERARAKLPARIDRMTTPEGPTLRQQVGVAPAGAKPEACTARIQEVEPEARVARTREVVAVENRRVTLAPRALQVKRLPTRDHSSQSPRCSRSDGSTLV